VAQWVARCHGMPATPSRPSPFVLPLTLYEKNVRCMQVQLGREPGALSPGLLMLVKVMMMIVMPM